jgi:hypothetical protein
MIMNLNWRDPEALAGADQVEMIELPSINDRADSRSSVFDLQIRRVVARYPVSLSLAMVIAEIAFASGRQA